MRPRGGEVGKDNYSQHAVFLAKVGQESAQHADVIAWFKTLPLWLDLSDGFRVVHACWHQSHMDAIKADLTGTFQMTEKLMVLASRAGSKQFRAVETLIKGPEIPLPDGKSFIDKHGKRRTNARVRWWASEATTYQELAHVPDESLREQLPTDLVPVHDRLSYDNAKPVFFGHYWMTGAPQRQSPTIACVDYSAGKAAGPLVAYRWEGKGQEVEDKNFVSAL